LAAAAFFEVFFAAARCFAVAGGAAAAGAPAAGVPAEAPGDPFAAPGPATVIVANSRSVPEFFSSGAFRFGYGMFLIGLMFSPEPSCSTASAAAGASAVAIRTVKTAARRGTSGKGRSSEGSLYILGTTNAGGSCGRQHAVTHRSVRTSLRCTAS
jgi:hypothetical protein